MEARFLQERIEALSDKRVFLDSDDLTDLRHITQHVRASECLLLVQSKNVLTRPWCLIELMSAVEAGVPIVGVALHGRPSVAYDFANASAFLRSLDTQLDQWGLEQLIEHGIDPKTAAWRLSCYLPKIISVGLNVCSSRNVLNATIHDVLDTIHSCTGAAVPECPTRDEWLTQRLRLDTGKSGRVASHTPDGGHHEVGVDGNSSRGEGGDTGVTGSGLLTRVKGMPSGSVRHALLGMAYVLQGVSLAATSSKHMVDDCSLLAALMSSFERELLALPDLAGVPLTALQQFGSTCERIMEMLQMLGRESVSAKELGAYEKKGGFSLALASLRKCADTLGCVQTGELLSKARFPSFARLDESARARAEAAEQVDVAEHRDLRDDDSSAGSHAGGGGEGVPLPSMRSAEQEVLLSTLQRQLQEQRERNTASATAQLVLAEQNKMLERTVKQMQSMLEQQSMMMADFMSKFPLPPTEPERLVALKSSALDKLKPGMPCLEPLDDMLAGLVARRAFGDHLMAIMVNLILAENQLPLSFAADTGQRILTPSNAKVDTSAIAVPRKLTSCQYVIAADDVVCLDRGQLAQVMKDGGSALGVDPAFGMLSERQADGYTRMEKFHDPLNCCPDEGERELFAAFAPVLDPGTSSTGFPMRIDGHPVASLCLLFRHLPTASPSKEVLELAKAKAAQATLLLEGAAKELQASG